MWTLLLACEPVVPWSESPFEVVFPDASPIRVDPRDLVEVEIRLHADEASWAGRDTWPSLSATLSGGEWVGGEPEALATTDTRRSLWFLPDVDALAALVSATLLVDGRTFAAEGRLDYCPRVPDALHVAVSAVEIAVGEEVTVTVAAWASDRGALTAGTRIAIRPSDPATMSPAPVPVLLSGEGEATASFVARAAGATTFEVERMPVAREGCPDEGTVLGSERVTVVPEDTGA